MGRFTDWLFGEEPTPAVPLAKSTPVPLGEYYPQTSLRIMDPGIPILDYDASSISPEAMYRSQPNLRRVVDFIANSLASLPVNLYERLEDGGRVKVRNTPLSKALKTPSPGTSSYSFFQGLLLDYLLFDKFAALVVRTPGGLEFKRLPAKRVRMETNLLGDVIAIYFATEKDEQLLPLQDVIYAHGYEPGGGAGYSPVKTLGGVLLEAEEQVLYRRQLIRNGGRMGGWISRPGDAPAFTREERQVFKDSFNADYSRNGEKAGGTPLLEEGMEYHEVKTQSPSDLEDIEARRLTAMEVSTAFRISPELLGLREGHYASVSAFNETLYRDALSGYIAMLEGVFNAQLLPLLALDTERFYVEANLEAKLRGSFEVQAQVLQASVGAPYLTRNEARARMNLPSQEGGDELVTPLNVLIGGQASPQDSGSQNLGPKALTLDPASELGKALLDAAQGDIPPNTLPEEHQS